MAWRWTRESIPVRFSVVISLMCVMSLCQIINCSLICDLYLLMTYWLLTLKVDVYCTAVLCRGFIMQCHSTLWGQDVSCPWSRGLRQKKKKELLVSVVVPPAPVRVPSQRRLAPSVAQSRRSLMTRVIMKWSWGLCTDLLEFALQKTHKQIGRASCREKV